MATIFTSAIADGVKLTLDEVVNDDMGLSQSTALYSKYMSISNMADNYVDDLSMGGIGLASETGEGTELPSTTLKEDYLTRYFSRKFGLKLAITEEAIEDNKYEQILMLGKRLPRALYKTIDMDCTNIFIRATNANYIGGDGQPLASAAHTLANGGTFSNTLATPLSPSRIAMTVVATALHKLPGHDGTVEGYEPKKIVCPEEQRYVWRGILGSEKAPEPGQFNQINVVKTDMDIDLVPIKYWTTTTTNWGVISDADNGLKFKWRRKPRTRDWVDNAQEIMNYAISCRYSRGWSDPRCFLFSNA